MTAQGIALALAGTQKLALNGRLKRRGLAQHPLGLKDRSPHSQDSTLGCRRDDPLGLC